MDSGKLCSPHPQMWNQADSDQRRFTDVSLPYGFAPVDFASFLKTVRQPVFFAPFRFKSRSENPQKQTRAAQKDTIIDITSNSQVNSNLPYRWSPASLTFINYFYLFCIFRHFAVKLSLSFLGNPPSKGSPP